MAVHAKVFWRCSVRNGSNSALHGPPLGKLHAEAIQLLQQHGWHELDTQAASSTTAIPVFAFTTRKGADFPAHGDSMPLVRQLPQRCSAVLDDKRLMYECLAEAGCDNITPTTWIDVDTFLQRQVDKQAGGDGDRMPSSSSSSEDGGEALWFLKHRHGVKGQAVYPFTDLRQLQAHAAGLSPGTRSSFVVQRGVHPPLLLHGRKFVLRAHVLVTAMPHFAAWVHEDVIVVEHAEPYRHGAGRAVHISSAGRNHPAPYLLAQLPDPALAASLEQQVAACAAAAVSAAAAARPHSLLPPDADTSAVLYQLFGLDLVAAACGRLYIIEANSYPAIASGTMARVDRSVYTRLAQDLLTTLVLPAADGVAPDPGGFHPLPVVAPH